MLSIAKGLAEKILLGAGDKIMLTMPIPGNILINTSAIIRHVQENGFGVEFVPKLAPSVLGPLSSWIFRIQEEEREHVMRTMDAIDETEESADTEKLQGKVGIILVTAADEMEKILSGLLAEDRDFSRIPPSVASLQEVLQKKPHLAIFHMTENGPEERRLMESLAKIIPQGLPILLLGSNIDTNALFELGQKWNAVASITWTEGKAILIQRLVLGILRKHYSQGESPMVSTYVQ
jgi:hypothetical protein